MSKPIDWSEEETLQEALISAIIEGDGAAITQNWLLLQIRPFLRLSVALGAARLFTGDWERRRQWAESIRSVGATPEAFVLAGQVPEYADESADLFLRIERAIREAVTTGAIGPALEELGAVEAAQRVLAARGEVIDECARMQEVIAFAGQADLVH